MMNTKNDVTRQVSVRKFVEIEGNKLGYQVAGEGPVMLCLPGLGDTDREYEYFAPAMVKAGYRVITTDLRGNGQSQGKFKSYQIEDLSQDIAAILDAEGVERAYIVSCSISGASAGLFIGQQPERVIGSIFFSPVFYTGNMSVVRILSAALSVPGLGAIIWANYFKSLYPLKPIDADYLAHVKANLRQPSALRSLTKMAVVRHLDEKTNQIKTPALIFFGDKDPDFKDIQAEAKKVAAAIPQAEITVLAGVGHYPQREVFDEILPKSLEWLAKHK